MKIVASLILYYDNYEPVVEVDEMLTIHPDKSVFDSIEIDANDVDQLIMNVDNKYLYEHRLLVQITVEEEYLMTNSIDSSDTFSGQDVDYYVRDMRLIDALKYSYD